MCYNVLECLNMKIKSIVQNLIIVMKYTRWLFFLKIFEVIISSLAKPFALLITKNVIDNSIGYYKGNTEIQTVVFSVVLLVICTFFSANIQSLDSLINEKMKIVLSLNFSKNIIQKASRIEYACFEQKDNQDIFQRIGTNPSDKIFNLFTYLCETIGGCLTIIGLVLVFIQISWWMSLLFVLILFVVMFFDFRAMETMNTMFNNQTMDERLLSYYSKVMEQKNSIMELKIYNAVGYIKEKLNIKSSNVVDERTKTTIRAQRFSFVGSVLVLVWVGTLITILILSAANGKITFGLFVSLIGSAESVLWYTENLSFSFSKLSQNYLEMKYYSDFMDLPEEKRKQNDVDVSDDEVCEVSFENVSFTYPNSIKPVLNDITFSYRSNQSLAIVGDNGSGKTTLIKLLCGLYKPDKGRITINNIDIDELDYKDRTRYFSVIFQDFIKYKLTIRENVAISDVERMDNDDELYAVLDDIGFSLENYDLEQSIGKFYDNGVDLSGGQWQRLAISRALFSNSRFIILDEPTAALDPVAESNLYKLFKKIIQQRGYIMISHRLASARLCDKILVLNNGSIIEQGSHDELMLNSGYYNKMYTKQSEWYK